MYNIIDEYFKRINYQGDRTLCPKVLNALHRQHVLSIPFENLDVHLNNPIAFDEESLIKKIIRGGRGGYCYEMNGLFALILKKLGFKVTYLAARVRYNVPDSITLPRMHMLLKVEILGSSAAWLCDVGFGGNGLLEAIPLRIGDFIYTQEIEGKLYGKFQLETIGNKYVLSTKIGSEVKKIYEFTLEEYQPEDFIPFNYFQSNSPDAPFTKRIFCTIPTKTGRVILDGLNLKIRETNIAKEEKITSLGGYQKVLKEHFKIEIFDISGLKIKASNTLLFN